MTIREQALAALADRREAEAAAAQAALEAHWVNLTDNAHKALEDALPSITFDPIEIVKLPTTTTGTFIDLECHDPANEEVFTIRYTQTNTGTSVSRTLTLIGRGPGKAIPFHNLASFGEALTSI